MIKCIVFDIGGVIVEDLSNPLLEYLSKKHRKQFGNLKAKYRLYYYEYRIGKITEKEFWQKFIKSADIKETPASMKRYARRFFNKKVKGTLDIARELKKDYKLAILSNHTKEWVDYLNKKHKLKTLFNPIVISYDEGCAKPEPKIYDALLKKLKLKSNECLFIDNRESNDITADSLGFNNIIFKDAEQLVHELKKLGLWDEKVNLPNTVNKLSRSSSYRR